MSDDRLIQVYMDSTGAVMIIHQCTIQQHILTKVTQSFNSISDYRTLKLVNCLLSARAADYPAIHREGKWRLSAIQTVFPAEEWDLPLLKASRLSGGINSPHETRPLRFSCTSSNKFLQNLQLRTA